MPNTIELLDQPLTALAERLRAREISPVELLELHVERIEAVNPTLNALVAERFDLARAEARAAERRFGEGGDLPPLLGIPCSIKEFLQVEGMPHTAGIWRNRDHRAREDAEVVRRLRQAGAIVVGVTNVPEGGLWMETYNRIWGRTNNPWDPSRTSGGSSGGDAALVAAGAVPFGIGSDVGGSVRIPALMCGTFAHKPTGRRLPNTGHANATTGDAAGALAIGPLTRSAGDLWPLLRVMAGPDGVDAHVTDGLEGAPDAVRIEDVVVHYVEPWRRPRLSPAMAAARDAACRALQDRGARIEPIAVPELGRIFDLWSGLLASCARYEEIVAGPGGMCVLLELARLPLGRSVYTAPVVITIAAERLQPWVLGEVAPLLEARAALQRRLEELLGASGVLLHPPYSRCAPRHGHALLTPFDFVCTALFNVLEFPVTQVPWGFDPCGLPVGVQVAARRGNDALTVAVARVLEEEGGGWRRAMG